MIGAAAAVATAFLWALTSMLVKIEARRMSVLAINAYRATVGSLALVAVFLLVRDPATLATVSAGSYATLVASVLLAMVGGATLNFLAIVRLGLGRAFPISGGYPLGTLLLAAIFLGEEQVGWAEAAGAVLTLVGVVLVALPSEASLGATGRRANWSGVAMALGAAVCWALASIVTKLGMAGVELLTATTIRLPAASLALWFVLVAREGWPPRQPPWRLTRRSWTSMVIAGLLGPALSTYLWMLGIQEIGAARTDVIAATGPVFAVILAAVFLKEPVGWRVVAGTLLSVAGIMLVVGRLGG